MTLPKHADLLIGRRRELGRLAGALRRRQSLLIWGPASSGKTALARALVDGLRQDERANCLYAHGPASCRELASTLVEQAYNAGSDLLHRKIEGEAATSVRSWLREQSSMRLKNLFLAAAQAERYSIFLDNFSPPTYAMARRIREIIWRGKTPVYLIARGCTTKDLGHAWGVFFAPEYRLELAPLPETDARALLEASIGRFNLDSLELDGFREEMLNASGLLPGNIVEMCRMAADPHFHSGVHIKTKLIRIERLMQTRIPERQVSPRDPARSALH